MSQSQENLQTDERTEGRMDRPYFIGPFWLPPGVQKKSQTETSMEMQQNFIIFYFV